MTQCAKERESESESKVLRWKKLVFSAQKLEDEKDRRKRPKGNLQTISLLLLNICPLSLTILDRMGGINSLPNLQLHTFFTGVKYCFFKSDFCN